MLYWLILVNTVGHLNFQLKNELFFNKLNILRQLCFCY